jgi:hypothetical protein
MKSCCWLMYMCGNTTFRFLKTVKKMEYLVDPLQQLYNTGSISMKCFADKVCSRVMELVDEKSTENGDLEESYFKRSFVDDRASDNIVEMVQSDLADLKFDHALVLPPLVLRSNERFVARSTDILFLGYSEGPIIPIVKKDKYTAHADLINRFYQKHDSEWVTGETFSKYY